MVTDLQTKVTVDTADARAFVRRLGAALRLTEQWFNVCFVDDNEIRRLNGEFRRKPKSTDVLSFPWRDTGLPQFGARSQQGDEESRWGGEFAGFLGDIVISAETARRNAAGAGHSTLHEIRWLILHGALHLLGYDHSTDDGEMTTLELSLRGRLGINGLKGKSKSKEQKAKIMKKTRLKRRHSSLKDGSRKKSADAN